MPRISNQKREKIVEQILHYLFSESPKAQFTSQIAASLARDEEFTKSLLLELKNKGLIVEVNKNSLGTQYLRRQRWQLASEVFNIYQRKTQQTF